MTAAPAGYFADELESSLHAPVKDALRQLVRQRRVHRQAGRKNYPDASHLLILADSGGSNGARVRMWKWALQEQLADRFGLDVTVCHFHASRSIQCA